MRLKNNPSKREMILVIGVMLILSPMFAYAATSIELTTGNFINVFGNLNLSGNNLVNAGNVSIKGNLSVDGNVSIGNSTLFVDSTNERVGINTTNPAQTLTIQGTLNVTPAGQMSNASLFVTSGGNVGIGTSTPLAALHIKRNSNPITQDLLSLEALEPGLTLNATRTDNGKIVTAWTLQNQYPASSGMSSLFFNQNGSTKFTLANDGNVGIGVTNPNSLLQLAIVGGTAIGSNLSLRLTESLVSGSVLTQIGFGAAQGSVFPSSVIGEVMTSGTGFANGALFFATRDVTTDTAPTERMRITSAGNVGIGTASPSDYSDYGEAVKLVVNDDALNTAIIISSLANKTGNLYFANGSVNEDTFRGYITYEQAGDNMRFGTLNAERMRIDGSGKVGIGTTSPNKTLDISVSGDDSSLRIRPASSGTTGGGYLYGGAAHALYITAGAEYLGGSTIARQTLGAGSGQASQVGLNGANVIFYTNSGLTNDNTFTFTERMRIDSSGNVGIGNTTPTSKLVVNTGADRNVILGQDSGATNYNALSLNGDVTDAGNTGFFGGATGDNDLYIQSADDIRFRSGGNTVKMALLANGNVGINQTSPTQTLSIVGNVCLDDNAGTACSARTIPIGAMEAEGAITGNAFDVAERFYTSENVEAGDVVVFEATSQDYGMAASVLDINESQLRNLMQSIGINETIKLIEEIENEEESLITGNAVNELEPVKQLKQKVKERLKQRDDYIGGSTGKDKLLASKAASVRLTDIQNDAKLLGVVSSDPAFIMGSYSDLNKGNNVPVALLGRVPVKVSLENGEIKAGDALTSSARKGYAAKAVRSGRIIGYAMEDYKTAANTEKIMVFVQPGWHQSEELSFAPAPSADLGYQKINGSVIIRLG